MAGFKSEVVKSQELHLASLMRDTERLTTNLGNLRNEIRYEVEKLTASQRLDLNLEKGRMRDELQVRIPGHWHICLMRRVSLVCTQTGHAAQSHATPSRDASRDSSRQVGMQTTYVQQLRHLYHLGMGTVASCLIP